MGNSGLPGQGKILTVAFGLNINCHHHITFVKFNLKIS